MLEGREMAHIIDCTVDVPVDGDSAEVLALKVIQARDRRKNDAKVRGLFVSKLSEDAVSLVQDAPTAYEMVQRLASQYQSNSAASALSRIDRLLDTEFKSGADMGSHIGAMNAIINQIKGAGGLDVDKLFVVALLRSMPKTTEWQAIVTSLKAQDEITLTKEKVARALTENAEEIRTRQVWIFIFIKV